MEDIPEPARGDGVDHIIPPTAAILPEEEESPEILPYNISFARYREDECQINQMTGNNAKATLLILRDIGVHFMSEKDFSSKVQTDVMIQPIVNDGDYGTLYKGLIDEEVKEIKYAHKRKEVDIRLFYFTLERERMFYLIATRQTHLDTDKGDYKKRIDKKKRRFN